MRAEGAGAGEPEPLTIGGARWRVIRNSTLEHDFSAMRAARAIGVDAAGLLPGETPEAFAERLLFQVIDSGGIFRLLGCLLLPVDVPDDHWTPEEAERTETFLKALRDPEDKTAVRGLVSSLLLGFFAEGLRSSPPSPAASTTGERARPDGQ